MRTEFREAIAYAGRLDDASSMVLAIKRAVANEIRAADPSVSVAFTDYFDNLFVPDLVLRWPAEKRERLVYVRANPSADWLLDGIEYISAHKAMVFTLEDLSPSDETTALNENRRKLARTALVTDTWITDPSGVAAVSAVRGEQAYLGLLGQALLQGGRGVYGGSEVAELVSKTAAGFAASRRLSLPETLLAVQAIEASLDTEQSARLTGLMSAVWEGHGGTAASFPRASSAGNERLLHRFSSGAATPPTYDAFWRATRAGP